MIHGCSEELQTRMLGSTKQIRHAKAKARRSRSPHKKFKTPSSDSPFSTVSRPASIELALCSEAVVLVRGLIAVLSILSFQALPLRLRAALKNRGGPALEETSKSTQLYGPHAKAPSTHLHKASPPAPNPRQLNPRILKTATLGLPASHKHIDQNFLTALCPQLIQ